MDTFSHALWGGGLYGYRGYFWLAVFFGAFPDLMSFGILFVLQLVSGDFAVAAPPLHTIPDWVFINYDLTHSFVTSFTVIGIVAWWRRDIAFAMLGWPFHVVLDAPFHTSAYFPTHIFYPFSDYFIEGIPWTHPLIWFPNLAGVLILFGWRWRRRATRGRLKSKST